MSFYVGLDLGQAADFTALAVLEAVCAEELERELHLRYLERYPLRTPYTAVADGVVALVEKLRDLTLLRTEPDLLVDNTGVGRAVTDVLRDKGLRFKAITLTGGSQLVRGDAGEYRVPKADVVDALVVPFQAGTLKVARGLELWPTLRTELLNFRRKINPATAHTSYEHWRESDHDDLVLAAALAAWGRNASRTPPRPTLGVSRRCPGPRTGRVRVDRVWADGAGAYDQEHDLDLFDRMAELGVYRVFGTLERTSAETAVTLSKDPGWMSDGSRSQHPVQRVPIPQCSPRTLSYNACM